VSLGPERFLEMLDGPFYGEKKIRAFRGSPESQNLVRAGQIGSGQEALELLKYLNNAADKNHDAELGLKLAEWIL